MFSRVNNNQEQITHFKAFIRKLLTDLGSYKHLRQDVSEEKIDTVINRLLEAVTIQKGNSSKVIKVILADIVEAAHLEYEDSPPSLFAELLASSVGDKNLSEQIELKTMMVRFQMALKIPPKALSKHNVVKADTHRYRRSTGYRGVIFTTALLGSLFSVAFLFLVHRARRLRERAPIYVAGKVKIHMGSDEDVPFNKDQPVRLLSDEEAKELKKSFGIKNKPVVVYCFYGQAPNYAGYPVHLSKLASYSLNMNSLTEFLTDFAVTYGIKEDTAIVFDPDNKIFEIIKPQPINSQLPDLKIKVSDPTDLKTEGDFINLLVGPRPDDKRYFCRIDSEQCMRIIANLAKKGTVKISDLNVKPPKHLSGHDLPQINQSSTVFYLSYNDKPLSTEHEHAIHTLRTMGFHVYQLQCTGEHELKHANQTRLTGAFFVESDAKKFVDSMRHKVSEIGQHGPSETGKAKQTKVVLHEIENEEMFDKMLVRANKKPVMLVCYMNGCSSCDEILGQIVQSDIHLVDFYKVNCDADVASTTNPRQFSKTDEGKHTFPTLILLSPDKPTRPKGSGEWEKKRLKHGLGKKIFVGKKECKNFLSELQKNGLEKK